MSAPPLGALLLALAASLVCTSRVSAQAEAPDFERSPAVLFVGPRPRTLPPRIAERERTLALHLGELSARSSRHVLYGALQGAVGAGFVVAGSLLHDEYARGLLILIGSGTLAHGLVQLLLVPNGSVAATAYEALPMFTADQVRARIHYGEQALARLAQAGRRTRIVEGTVTMATASGYVPLLWWFTRRADANRQFGDSSLDYVGLALSVISFGSGLATALIESEAELRYNDYREQRLGHERAAPRELERLSRRSTFGLTLTAQRVELGARLRF